MDEKDYSSMASITQKDFYHLLEVVSRSPENIDLDITSALLEGVANGSPDRKEDAIEALLTLLKHASRQQ